jgi:hypothetical protein
VGRIIRQLPAEGRPLKAGRPRPHLAIPHLAIPHLAIPHLAIPHLAISWQERLEQLQSERPTAAAARAAADGAAAAASSAALRAELESLRAALAAREAAVAAMQGEADEGARARAAREARMDFELHEAR